MKSCPSNKTDRFIMHECRYKAGHKGRHKCRYCSNKTWVNRSGKRKQ